MKTIRTILFVTITGLFSFHVYAQSPTLAGNNTFTGKNIFNDQVTINNRVFIPHGYGMFIGSMSDSGNRLRFNTSSDGGTTSYMDYYPRLLIRTGDGSPTPVIRLTSAGNVGIGTVKDPTSYKLEVNGTIRAKEIKVEATGWADFVFDPSYELPSLKEVKLHIEENRHLPGIPSEGEVLENGIHVSEMTAKLLQKVEELTLYAIQQNEQLEEQKAINEKLMNKIEALENIK